MEQNPRVYYLNGQFLIFNRSFALTLRCKRVVGQLIGCSPSNPNQLITSGLPLILNHYQVAVILKESLAQFVKMKFSPERVVSKEIKTSYAKKLVELREEARLEFAQRRSNELKRFNLEETPDRLKQFDEKKMRLAVPSNPCTEYSIFETILMDKEEIYSLLKVNVDKTLIFDDLYKKGFYISSGTKFGSDFLLYCGDPVRYHAKYAIRTVATIDGLVNLKEVNYSEINALYRLCHAANKVAIFATVNRDSSEVKYWTLRLREYLTPESTNNVFESIIPSLNPI